MFATFSILLGSQQAAARTARLTGTVVDQAGHVVGNPGLTLTARATGERLRIVPPIKIRDQAPVYPVSVRGSGFAGKVVLEAVLKTDGAVEVVQILAPVDPATMTTAHPDLARAAVEAVAGWRYEPTLLHGMPVDTRMTISVDFRP